MGEKDKGDKGKDPKFIVRMEQGDGSETGKFSADDSRPLRESSTPCADAPKPAPLPPAPPPDKTPKK